VLHFLSHDMELCVQDVLVRDNGLKLCVGQDFQGQWWLLYRALSSPDRQVWVCAPESERAIECVRQGSASVRDALMHSLTGTVEIVTSGPGASRPDRCVVCVDIPAELLPSSPWRLPARAA
jgi:hypothetical protein